MKNKISSKTAGLCGILSPITGFLFIALSILLHPWFTFSGNALSDLGMLGKSYIVIFSMALISMGALGLVFSFKLPDLVNGRIGVSGSLLFGVGVFFIILIGLFPKGTVFHDPVAIVAFSSLFFGILLIGLDQLLCKSTRPWGVLPISILVLTVLSVMLLFTVPYGLEPAIPELIGLVMFSEFIIVFGAKLVLRSY